MGVNLTTNRAIRIRALDKMENDLCINYCGRHILQNAGHWVQQENPDDVSKTLLNFFEHQ